MAFVMSNISLSHNARELTTVDHMATRRNHPEDFHRLFADAVHMQQITQAARDIINTAVTVSGRDGKRPHSSLQHVTWIVVGELLTMCARIPLESPGVAVSD